jgi:hypothetical protein
MKTLILTSLAVLALVGGAAAQAPGPANPATTTTVGRKPATPESKACSAQADAKGLHGKDRQTFRRACLKGK